MVQENVKLSFMNVDVLYLGDELTVSWRHKALYPPKMGTNQTFF